MASVTPIWSSSVRMVRPSLGLDMTALSVISRVRYSGARRFQQAGRGRWQASCMSCQVARREVDCHGQDVSLLMQRHQLCQCSPEHPLGEGADQPCVFCQRNECVRREKNRAVGGSSAPALRSPQCADCGGRFVADSASTTDLTRSLRATRSSARDRQVGVFLIPGKQFIALA